MKFYFKNMDFYNRKKFYRTKFKSCIKILIDSPYMVKSILLWEHIIKFCKLFKENNYKNHFVNIWTAIPPTTISFL